MPKPRKKWEPEYRFGGMIGSPYKPLPLGQVNGYSPPRKARKSKKK